MNVNTLLEQLNEVDLAILQAVQDGHDDTMKIREATTLENRSINHHLVEKKDSLEELGLVDIYRSDDPERRTVDGRIHYLPYAPKRITLTERGQVVLQETEDIEKYEGMSKEELIQLVREHEDRITELETRFDVFRRQVTEVLDQE